MMGVPSDDNGDDDDDDDEEGYDGALFNYYNSDGCAMFIILFYLGNL